MAPNNGPLLVQLWHGLLAALNDLLKDPKRPGVELLAVTRRFLSDNQQVSPGADDRKKLEQLHRLYSKKLAEALAAERVPASMLAEGRKWLELHGVKADVPAAVAAQVAKRLADGSLPFSPPPTKQ
jgi:hypothetical protein